MFALLGMGFISCTNYRLIDNLILNNNKQWDVQILINMRCSSINKQWDVQTLISNEMCLEVKKEITILMK